MAQTAQVSVMVITVTCPQCLNTARTAPNGSFNLTEEQIVDGLRGKHSDTFNCERCGETLRMPRTARVL